MNHATATEINSYVRYRTAEEEEVARLLLSEGY
jgi:hypothetical protein